MQENQNKLVKISKKYTNRSIKTWEHPPKSIISSINKILTMNKTKTLQITCSKNSNLIQQDLDLDEFIRLYLRQIKHTKLPGNLNEFDYDYDYQLHKENFLSTLYSNELKQVAKLKDNLIKDELKKKSIKEFVQNYEKIYNQEFKNLNSMDEIIVNSINSTNELGNIKTLEMSTIDETKFEELDELLQHLDTQLDRIDECTKHYQELSTKLDEVMNPI